MLLGAVNGLGSIGEFLTVLVIFLFVLAITFGTTKWIANYQKIKTFNSNIQVIETYKITPNKCIQIVKAGSKFLVIAVCKDTVTLLSELTEEQITLPELEEHSNMSFKEILEKTKNLAAKKK